MPLELMAVHEMGMFVTGGHSSGELWIPKEAQAQRLGNANQEHCLVYHMMCLAEYLFRWTGDAKYADYWERNLYNGIFAQGFYQEHIFEPTGGAGRAPRYGYVAYYLPITDHFYHCTNEILSSLGKMYSGGGEFTENIDKVGGAGTGEFTDKAIEIYCIK